ncbi:MAG: tyrosine--tRNA ligase [Desulfurococcales archaeon]|nr:tyrosine--tRNA ligase [Desulfurococcales archaeon]
MDVEERLKLITRNTVEIITVKELREKLETGSKIKGYIGYEPSGLTHVGWLVWIMKVRDLVEAGVDFTVLEATWHAYINDKLGGDMNLIRQATTIIRKTMEALGVPVNRIKFVDAEELASDKRYWEILIRVAKKNTLARIKRALTIMGRKMEEAELDSSKIIYPLMQVSDIFYLDLDLALGGLDQRKAHMLARDTAEKLGFKKPIAIHTPIISSLKGIGRMDTSGLSKDEIAALFKMSKSIPESTIFLHEDDDTIRRKIRKAYCPPRQTERNPIIEINKYILFAQPNFKLVVDRPKKYGGRVVYESYSDLERDYIEGRLHPADLKNATAEALIELLRPVREALLGDPKIREYIEMIMGSVSK